jgi:SAM-dependent methyltransferase
VVEEAAYDRVANEYYDDLHKTSRNFDEATKAALKTAELEIPDGLVLEPGSGRGRCGEFLGLQSSRVVHLDNSERMLSLAPREESLLRVRHDAEVLPFADAEFSCVAAFLCDPFLGLNFLTEARRVLKPGGVLIGTTPSSHWGLALRKNIDIDPMMTRFVLRTGETIQVPSALFSVDELREMLSVAGFDSSGIDISGHSLPEAVSTISPDISAPAERMGISVYALGILDLFVARA